VHEYGVDAWKVEKKKERGRNSRREGITREEEVDEKEEEEKEEMPEKQECLHFVSIWYQSWVVND
jgi:hypothetical protein